MSDVMKDRDRLTEVRVEGMRALADVRLPLVDGLTVLIGDNGTGKSSLVEALELLRGAARPGGFVPDWLVPFHGGLRPLLRDGAKTLRITARIEGGGPRIDYSFALAGQPTTIICEERLDVWEDPGANEPLHAIVRDTAGCRVFDPHSRKQIPVNLGPGMLALHFMLNAFGVVAQPAHDRVVTALINGRVHVPFAVQPLWVTGQPSPLRMPAQVGLVEKLDRLGGNLANCYHLLASNPPPGAWQRTLERVRGGLGADVTNITTPAAGPGLIELAVHFRGFQQPIPASALSDGQLTFLGFVALAELGKGHSFLAFDEPELHLHPELLVRVVWLLEELASSCPVVISTHSDRLLDGLSDPAKSVVLCELDEHRATRLFRPDAEALKKWLERYRGLGQLRAEGYTPHVLTEPVEPGQ